jgi:hypothetical protein
MLDAVAITLLAALLWRLRRDPTAAWQAHEERLRQLFESLRLLAAQSEGVARDLDGALGAHEERLRTLLADARRSAAPAARAAEVVTRPAETASAPPTRDADVPSARDDLLARVWELASAATPIDEIARRVDMPAAEVRVLVGLGPERRAPGATASARGNGPRRTEARA